MFDKRIFKKFFTILILYNSFYDNNVLGYTDILHNKDKKNFLKAPLTLSNNNLCLYSTIINLNYSVKLLSYDGYLIINPLLVNNYVQDSINLISNKLLLCILSFSLANVSILLLSLVRKIIIMLK